MDKRENKNKKTKKQFLSRLKETALIRFGVKDQAFFAKRLAFLTKAGIPVLESLTMIRDQTRGKGYGKVLDSIINDVSNGQYLSTAMTKYRNLFGDFSINIISFGETGGILSENLEYLADELKKKHALKKKVISAFIYPAIVTIATLGITAFLMIYLFPKIIPIFSSIHMELPLSTRIVMFASNSIRHYGLLILGIIALISIGVTVLVKKNKSFHFYFDSLILKTPILGTIVKYYNLANGTRTMGLLLKSGLPVSEALPIAGKTSTNLVYKREFTHLSAVINRGEKMSVYLNKRRKLFPDVIPQIVSVGERSGNLSHSLIYLSEMYEAEVEDFTKNLSGLIEPILMIFMGLMVGFIAISIITPIYGITQHLQVK